MPRAVTITPYRRAVLSTLDVHKGTSAQLGDSPAHFEAACRVMEQAGLVGRNLHDRWYLRPEGRKVIDR